MNALLTLDRRAPADSPRVATAAATRAGLRILLLTPYSGGNLGDAAIQEAVAHQLRKRLSEPRLRLITLSPQTTTALHGLPSFPIARGNFAPVRPANPGAAKAHAAAGNPVRTDGLVKRCLRRIPWLRDRLAALGHAGRRAKSYLQSVPEEFQHVGRSWRLLQESDLLVMSGGGQIDDYWGGAWGHPYALFKWAWLARMAGTPVVFLSVGVCTVHTWLGHRFATSALRLAAYRSYRDHGSKELLRAAAFTRDDPEFPDLAFSHPCTQRQPEPARDRESVPKVVGISPLAFLRPQIWPEGDAGVHESYLQALCDFAAKVLAEGHEVVVFTSALMDGSTARELEARLRQRPESQVWSHRLKRVDQTCLEKQLEEIAKMDVVVASRLHGIILSHLLGKPVLAISYDRKVRAHMEAMSQERFCVDLRDGTAARLWEGLVRLQWVSVAAAAVIRGRIAECGQKLDRQYDQIVQTLLVK